MRLILLTVLVATINACGPATTRQPVGVADAVAAPQAVPHAAAFDQADRRARAVLEQIRCAQRVAALRREGVFGPIDSLGRIGQCAVVAGRHVGVFFDADTLFTGVSRFSAVDLASSARFFGPVDTSAILAVARASRTAQIRGRADYEREQRPYAPLAFRFDDAIEAWILPVAVLSAPPLTAGGERGYVFSPDGRTVVREIDAFNAFRSFAPPETGPVRINSSERGIPSLTELLLAILLNERGRTATIVTESFSSTLAGEGDAGVWVHVRRQE